MITFQDLRFRDVDEDKIEVRLYGLFYGHIDKKPLKRFGEFKVHTHGIEFMDATDARVEKKLMQLLDPALNHLTSSLSGFPAHYINKYSNIPMQGLHFLGFSDKGSEMIEVKPITNCNMNCTFCSVDEGPDTTKQVDFVVERQFLTDELRSLLEFKQAENLHIWINPHGEPLLYQDIVPLVAEIKTMPGVNKITIITNGMLLTTPLIDQLAEAGLTDFSVSISGFEKEKAKEMMGSKVYNIDKVLRMLAYAQEKINVTITPVYLAGENDKEMESLISYAKEHNFNIQIQKFCTNKRGRNPIKETSWEEFSKTMAQWESALGVQLTQPLGKLKETKERKVPFRHHEIVEVDIKYPGRRSIDGIGVARDRAVLVLGCGDRRGPTKCKVVRYKHNIIVATPYQ